MPSAATAALRRPTPPAGWTCGSPPPNGLSAVDPSNNYNYN
jgi:hypothetical protein